MDTWEIFTCTRFDFNRMYMETLICWSVQSFINCWFQRTPLTYILGILRQEARLVEVKKIILRVWSRRLTCECSGTVEDEDGTDLRPQNKTLKTEVAKHKQELECLQQKVGHSLGFYTAVVACFVSHIDLFVQDVHKWPNVSWQPSPWQTQVCGVGGECQ